MPMVNVLTIVRWRGRNGYVQPDDRHRDREQRRVDRLGHEQVRRPLDVGDDATTLGDDTRQRREPAVEQHELRDGPRRRRTGAHGHADVGVLQRERVVHAVAGHRDHVPARLQRADHRPLLLRRDPAEHRVVLEHVGQLVDVVGQLPGVEPASSGAREPDPSRDRADRARVVARDHLEGDALLVEVARASRRRRAGSSPRASPAPRLEPRRQPSPSSGASLRARSSTRRPSAASSSARCRAG